MRFKIIIPFPWAYAVKSREISEIGIISNMEELENIFYFFNNIVDIHNGGFSFC